MFELIIVVCFVLILGLISVELSGKVSKEAYPTVVRKTPTSMTSVKVQIMRKMRMRWKKYL